MVQIYVVVSAAIVSNTDLHELWFAESDVFDDNSSLWVTENVEFAWCVVRFRGDVGFYSLCSPSGHGNLSVWCVEKRILLCVGDTESSSSFGAGMCLTVMFVSSDVSYSVAGEW